MGASDSESGRHVIFRETALPGSYIIESEPHHDSRGYFARAYCARELEATGIEFEIAQASVAFNEAKGTLRGLHYQLPPFAEAKIVRCIAGSIYDVIVDLRPDSPGYLEWIGVELSAANGRSLYVPEGFAHGYLTLDAATEVFYLMNQFYVAKAARGIRWDDARLGIDWPGDVAVISSKDQSWPDLVPWPSERKLVLVSGDGRDGGVSA